VNFAQGKALGWGHSQNKGPSFAPHFGKVPNPRALPIIKHKAKFIMNQTYVDHEVDEWEGSYTYKEA
jgi:hypothetical protein